MDISHWNEWSLRVRCGQCEQSRANTHLVNFIPVDCLWIPHSELLAKRYHVLVLFWKAVQSRDGMNTLKSFSGNNFHHISLTFIFRTSKYITKPEYNLAYLIFITCPGISKFWCFFQLHLSEHWFCSGELQVGYKGRRIFFFLKLSIFLWKLCVVQSTENALDKNH